MVTLTPENDSEKDVLRRSAEEEIDVTDGMLGNHILFYLERHFHGMSVLRGDFLREPGKY